MAEKEDKLEVELVDDAGVVIVPEEQKVNDQPGKTVELKTEVEKFDADAQARKEAEANAYNVRIADLEAQLDHAVRFSRHSMAETERLKALIQSGEKVLVGQAGGRLKAEMVAAEASYKKAYEEGDTAALIKATGDIARIKNEEAQVQNYQPVNVQTPQALTQPPQAKAKSDPKSDAWLDKNKDWWMKDDVMTSLALGLHQQAIKSGVLPGTDAYIQKLDEGMAKHFPDKFKNTGTAAEPARQPKPQGSVVAPATRTAGGKSTKVQITPSMASVARRLGVTTEKYAEELARLEQNG